MKDSLLMRLLTKVKSAIERWLSVAQEVVTEDGEARLSYTSPAQELVARGVALGVFLTAFTLQFMPNANPRTILAVDDMMRLAARL